MATSLVRCALLLSCASCSCAESRPTLLLPRARPVKAVQGASQEGCIRVRMPSHLQVLRGGSSGGGPTPVGDYRKLTLSSMVINRGLWLSAFLMSLSLTSVVMSGFEHTLAEHIQLAYFVPLLIGHGGNAGGQAVGAVLAALSAGQVNVQDWLAVVIKESLAGLGAGMLTCVAVVPLLIIMKISRHVSATILVTMPMLTVLATGLGAALPMLTSALGADPSVVAAPAMTTLVDVFGLLAYFMIAQLVFAAFGVKMSSANA